MIDNRFSELTIKPPSKVILEKGMGNLRSILINGSMIQTGLFGIMPIHDRLNCRTSRAVALIDENKTVKKKKEKSLGLEAEMRSKPEDVPSLK